MVTDYAEMHPRMERFKLKLGACSLIRSDSPAATRSKEAATTGPRRGNVGTHPPQKRTPGDRSSHSRTSLRTSGVLAETKAHLAAGIANGHVRIHALEGRLLSPVACSTAKTVMLQVPAAATTVSVRSHYFIPLHFVPALQVSWMGATPMKAHCFRATEQSCLQGENP